MGGFLRENWLWILIPALLVLGLLAWMIWGAGGDGGDAPFIYNI